MKYYSDNPLLAWMKKRIDTNKNIILVINGSTGSSKTYDALTLAYESSKLFGTNFTIGTNVDFEFINFIKKTRLPENSKPGTPFILEEVGAVGGGAAARDWQSKVNKLFFSFMQTTRHKNQILIFTCPQFSNLDAGARKLVHIQLTTSGINFKKRIAYVKPYLLQVNDRTEKIYFKYMRFKMDGKPTKLKMLGINHPPMHLVDEYEKIKTKFSEKLEKSILEEAKPKVELPRAKIDIDEVMYLKEKGYSNPEIAQKRGISLRWVQKLQQMNNGEQKTPHSAVFMRDFGVLNE